ncbi:unnamed protein product [Phytophthora fragariaefolia]|uniref:Unnamed protein product n=1 Tax=Phytophthora fragariaefolia TaxID=1490495 RepID=A0A9W6TZV4_9STRA|nr:unnamed protein product [Phytophthora fragariaefolia]
MARTQVVEGTAQTTTRTWRSQLAQPTQTTTPPAEGSESDPRTGIGRRDMTNDDEDDEVKREDSAADDHEHGSKSAGESPRVTQGTTDVDDSSSITMTPVAALTSALQQMADTMARMDARLDQLSTIATDTSRTTVPDPPHSRAHTATPPSTGNTRPPVTVEVPAQIGATAASRTVVYRYHDDGGSGDDGGEGDDSSSSSNSENDSDGSTNDGGGVSTLAARHFGWGLRVPA